MVDHSHMKLGKLSRKFDPRTPLFARYLAAAQLPPAPESVDFSGKLGPLGVMLNDSLGDCTCAAVGHQIQVWTSQTDAAPAVLPDSAILALYEAVGGYNPANPATDQGAVELDVLNYWLANPIGGHALAAYASLNVSDTAEVSSAVNIFGGAYIGIGLPITAQTQTVWDVPPGGPTGQGAPGSWGGHAVDVAGYNATGPVVITWGQLKQLTWAFWRAYVDEAYALASTDWIANGMTPTAIDTATWTADMAILKAS